VSAHVEALAALIQARFGEQLVRRQSLPVDLSYDVKAEALVEVMTALRDDAGLSFKILIDIAGIDYLDYGRSEWRTTSSSSSGFGRGVNRAGAGGSHQGPRFAAVYQLLSVEKNERVTLRAYCSSVEEPSLPSVVGVHAGANWFEREAFDLYGILFEGHLDLRRILTDYGFIGHPMRKDFPTTGNVEMRYDAEKKRVIYQPVSIEPREIVPRVVREDNYGGLH
jgi:NADH-quinone oxidoreductase subunit C